MQENAQSPQYQRPQASETRAVQTLWSGMAFSGVFARCQKVLDEHGVTVTSGPVVDADPKNAAYDACSLGLAGKQCAYRSAKITPTKNGAFVTCWKRPGGKGPIVPFSAGDLQALLVAVEEAGNFGFFVFPAEDLLKQGILAGSGRKGKLSFRVYAPWVVAESKQAAATQAWQRPFFVQGESQADSGPRYAGSGPSPAVSKVSQEDAGLMPLGCLLDDVQFFERVVAAWGVSRSFGKLAADITPAQVTQCDIDEVEGWILEVASIVWKPEDISLTLMGSCWIGTNILKQTGQSDRDYAIEVGQARLSPEEWQLFYNLLQRDSRFQEVTLGSKAIKFCDPKLRLEWELVPVRGHFSFELVTFPMLDGAVSTAARTSMRLQFFETYSGARNAVRVLKRLCPGLNGNIVEALAVRQGKDLLQQDASLAETDGSGVILFQHLICLFDGYPWSPPHPNSPIHVLLRDAAKYGREQGVKEALKEVSKIAGVIRARTTNHHLEEPFVCMTLGGAVRCMAVMGASAACFVTQIVRGIDVVIELPQAFADQAMNPRADCPGSSCLCSDLRDSWLTCVSSKDFDCEMLGFRLNRCTLTFMATSVNLGSHALLFIRTSRVACGLHRYERVPHVCLASASVCSVLVILGHLRFGGLGTYVLLSRRCSNVINTLSLAMSAGALILVWDSEARNSRLTKVSLLGFAFVAAFVPTVCLIDLASALRSACLDSGADAGLQFVQQNHVFYTLSLAFQLFFAWASWGDAPEMLQGIVRKLLGIQLFWQAIDTWYWAAPSLWPETQRKYNFLVILLCRLALALKLLGMVSLVKQGRLELHRQHTSFLSGIWSRRRKTS
ncbi:hypothetical protein AK812_SmicGene33024 [Symbiodinium microadriaticum]|uniref:Uncharacterized protein n=1 Tax=Symbiodinium microadriaticum TaxID=2951 RepID=A0A1Q9CSP0_SYMMI|nr:hypothetical protein AK812_SmicGene33024 [Symbiodinium microadriaticum]